MPVNIMIHAVPERVRDELAARAEQSGRSLQEYLRDELIEIASRPSPAEGILRARTRASRYPAFDASDALADLDVDRR